ncbi:Phosphotyrosine protein phosphatase I superfamily [Arabidopsis thaliana x Arabidopsis arenosa]|uniref:ADP-ribosyl cyclase/cyclic ADP-ribose hydrolase n=1 Tax=Arabidopsis thaliana x Arabidopsis arenosa TaxID=1240361 RepID=A0A8T1ZJM7_9BRAS|nr:Phosphotyrosine protein phosphatase I superfamily [Arabidopsis thaliana x Arabidopsis arenosa]
METTPTQSSETKPFSVLFVCLGNICRSPAAEGVFRDIVKKRGLDSKFIIDSAGTIDYHEGNMADPRMRSAAKRRGIELTSLSRPIKASDFREFDLILAMDDQNKEDILKAYNVWKNRGNFPPDADKKVKLMCSYCKKHNDKFVPDPYYGGAQGFEKVLDLLEDACESLLDIAAAIGFFMLFRKFKFQQESKDTKASSLSLPSPPTSVSQNWKHDVFPSFHGADVRRTLLSHIMESFRRKGIDPFIDNDIERSKSISPELKEAIKGSKIAIVLLSKNYASSSWCLDELAEIMKCREVLGQIVMTIFYEVDPTDIKKQTGVFGKAFKKTCKGKTKEHIERWRKALEDVATIAGEHSRNWSNEAEMIEKISIDVSNMLNLSIPSSDFDDFVGIAAHMERMEKYLSLDLDEVRMIGIWGPPGIGKTTIATCMFDRFSSRFPFAAIMVDIRECYPRLCLDERNAQLKLQKQMLSQIFNHKDIMISHLGVAQERLKDKKVILVLDEVDHLGQLDALAKEIQWFGPGSRIIITTEDLGVLKAHGISQVYKVDFPSNDEAFQIFCMNAFGQNQPHEGFCKLARQVMALAGKLPLGLKVLGSALRGMSKPEWERALPRLKASLDGKIGSIIQFSYDALCDEDKYLFLYIACLFNFKSVHRVEEFLANKFSHVRHGLHVLHEKSLISIEYKRIQMHTLLQQFGRKISRKQFVQHGLTKHQLLVGERDICDVLDYETSDSRRFIGINLDLSKTEEELNISEKALERMHDFQFVRIKDKNRAQTERLQSVLEGLIYHSQKIRLLDWSYFQDICLPSTFNPEFLVELNLQDSKLQKLWEGTKQLRNLKWMSLGGSKDLKELPDLSTATNLEEVDLRNCSSLVELPSSIGNATKLELLYLVNCSSLVKLPSSINAPNLQKLNLKNCSRIVELPDIENATNLRELDLSECSNLVELPSIGNASKLERMYLNNCSSLVKLPSSINAPNLQKLSLSHCSSLVKLPSSINATNLQELSLNNCSSVLELPEIENATNLEELYLRNCASLLELPPIGTATNLWRLDISGCSSLVKLPSSIGDITNLREFNLSGCSSIVELPSSIGKLTSLQILNLSWCSSLVKIPSSIEDATNLEELNLVHCSNLVELPSCIGNATKLELLYLDDCWSLVKLPSSINAPNLQELSLNNCSRIVELPAIENATSLWKLYLINCSSLVRIPSSIKNATNLRNLDLSDCSNLVELPSIGNASKLERLYLDNCSSLVKLPSSITAPNLQKLSLSHCSSLVKLPDIENATNLKELILQNCSSLLELPPSIGTATNLKRLNISGCSSLVKLPSSTGDITNLQEFNLSNCSSLVELPSSIGKLQKLSELKMRGCSKLEALPTNINLESLRTLDLTNCSQLKRFPEISTNIAYLRLTGTAIKEVPLSIMSWSRLYDFGISYFESLKEFPHALDIITELQLNEDIQEVAPWVKGMSRLRKLKLYNCNNLVSLPQLSDSLSYLDADNCQSLERLDCTFNNPDIRLKFSKCFNLNQEARDLIMNTSTFHPAILPGTQVPACFNHLEMLPDSSGGSLTIKLNESLLPTSLRFQACIMPVMGNEETGADQSLMEVMINIRDKQNDLKVRCTPSLYSIQPLLTEHIYTFEVETEKVTSTELVFEFKTRYSKSWRSLPDWKIKDLGISWRSIHDSNWKIKDLGISWRSLHDSNWKIKDFGISWRSLHVDERRWDTRRKYMQTRTVKIRDEEEKKLLRL